MVFAPTFGMNKNPALERQVIRLADKAGKKIESYILEEGHKEAARKINSAFKEKAQELVEETLGNMANTVLGELRKNLETNMENRNIDVKQLKDNVKFGFQADLIILTLIVIIIIWISCFYIIPYNIDYAGYLFNKDDYQVCTAKIVKKNNYHKGRVCVQVVGKYNNKEFKGFVTQSLIDKVGDEIKVVFNGRKVGRGKIIFFSTLDRADFDYYIGYIGIALLMILFSVFNGQYKFYRFIQKGDYFTTYCKAENIEYSTTIIGKQLRYRALGEFVDHKGKRNKYKSSWIMKLLDKKKAIYVVVWYSKKNPRKNYLLPFDEEELKKVLENPRKYYLSPFNEAEFKQKLEDDNFI